MVGIHCPPMVELLSRDFPQRIFGRFSNRLLGYLCSISGFPTSSTMHQKSRTLFRAQFACPISLLSYFHNGVQDIHPVSYIRFLTRAVSHLIFAALHTRRSCSLQSIRCAAPLTLVVWTKKGSNINLFYLKFFHENIEKKLLFHSHRLDSLFHCPSLLSKKNCIRFK